jgi:hypothetical protein
MNSKLILFVIISVTILLPVLGLQHAIKAETGQLSRPHQASLSYQRGSLYPVQYNYHTSTTSLNKKTTNHKNIMSDKRSMNDTKGMNHGINPSPTSSKLNSSIDNRRNFLKEKQKSWQKQVHTLFSSSISVIYLIELAIFMKLQSSLSYPFLHQLHVAHIKVSKKFPSILKTYKKNHQVTVRMLHIQYSNLLSILLNSTESLSHLFNEIISNLVQEPLFLNLVPHNSYLITLFQSSSLLPWQQSQDMLDLLLNPNFFRTHIISLSAVSETKLIQCLAIIASETQSLIEERQEWAFTDNLLEELKSICSNKVKTSFINHQIIFLQLKLLSLPPLPSRLSCRRLMSFSDSASTWSKSRLSTSQLAQYLE